MASIATQHHEQAIELPPSPQPAVMSRRSAPKRLGLDGATILVAGSGRSAARSSANTGLAR